MSALDNAIQAHMAHPAASGFDPLTDSLGDQAALAAPYALRPGWKDEPVTVPPPWRWMLLAFILTALGFTFPGCAALPPGFVAATEATPAVLAACPPLADLKRTDSDALALRVAEVERWYATCRNAATGGTPEYAPAIAPAMVPGKAP